MTLRPRPPRDGGPIPLPLPHVLERREVQLTLSIMSWQDVAAQLPPGLPLRRSIELRLRNTRRAMYHRLTMRLTETECDVILDVLAQ